MAKIFFTLVLVQFWAPFALSVSPYNQALLEIIKEMPTGGGYDTSRSALRFLESAVEIKKEHLKEYLEVKPQRAAPSFCSGATYLAFLQLLSQLQKEKGLELNLETQRELLVRGQPDGSGVWGRWNANGPGTARLFYELKLGRNFTLDKLAEAEPGDFLKIFWTDEIGAKERGHSVIFTGVHRYGKSRALCFWSSNKGSADFSEDGMGEKCVDLKKVRRAVFSRFEYPERLLEIQKKMGRNSETYTDPYLESLLEKPSSPREMCRKVGCQ